MKSNGQVRCIIDKQYEVFHVGDSVYENILLNLKKKFVNEKSPIIQQNKLTNKKQKRSTDFCK